MYPWKEIQQRQFQLWVCKYETRLRKKSLEPKIRQKSYTGNDIAVNRQIKVPVQLWGRYQIALPLIIVAGNLSTLLEQNWLKQLKLLWQDIFEYILNSLQIIDLQELLSV